MTFSATLIPDPPHVVGGFGEGSGTQNMITSKKRFAEWLEHQTDDIRVRQAALALFVAWSKRQEDSDAPKRNAPGEGPPVEAIRTLLSAGILHAQLSRMTMSRIATASDDSLTLRLPGAGSRGPARTLILTAHDAHAVEQLMTWSGHGYGDGEAPLIPRAPHSLHPMSKVMIRTWSRRDDPEWKPASRSTQGGQPLQANQPPETPPQAPQAANLAIDDVPPPPPLKLIRRISPPSTEG